MLAGLAPAPAVVAAFGLSLSSTAFVIQLLGEKNELTTAHGRSAFGILLFQDLAAIPALAIIPLLGAGAASSDDGSPLLQALLIVGVIVGLVLAGRFLLRPVFMTVGMSANIHVIVDHPALVLGIALGIVLVKLLVLVALGRMAGLPGASSISLGVTLAQGGEFAFVIYGVARTAGVLSPDIVEILIVAVTMSMIATPLAFIARDKLFAMLAAREGIREFDRIDAPESEVIIAGFGRYDDPEASVRTARTVREHFPHLRILARARNRRHVHALRALGIDDIVRETFYASLVTAQQVLENLGLPAVEAQEAVKTFGEYDEAALREQFHIRDDEAALIQSAKKVATDLEKLFEHDAAATP